MSQNHNELFFIFKEYCGNDDVGNDGDISDNVSTTVFKNKVFKVPH